MPERYKVAIIGSGPAGLSAAARAAQYDKKARERNPDAEFTHILLEGHNSIAKTLAQYQKGKQVMAEPSFLDLRSPLPFEAADRDKVLGVWQRGLEHYQINLRCDHLVKEISGTQGDFTIHCDGQAPVYAQTVVLAMGLQGNPRRLEAAPFESDAVLYRLDDPAKHRGETVVVVGAGDAAIENALGLADYNNIVMINRRDEFSRAKAENLKLVLAAINDKNRQFNCYYQTSVESVRPPMREGDQGEVVLNTPEGQVRQVFDRLLIRIGALAPRAFMESTGISFPSESADAVPDLDRQYQSNVPGIYVIGSQAGSPLIKQGLNQGYDVIERLRGKTIKPADYPLLEQQFEHLPYVMDAEDVLELYQRRVPMFKRMNALAFRELIIESQIMISMDEQDYRDVQQEQAGKQGKSTRAIRAGDSIFSHGDYSNTFYTVVEGEVKLRFEEGGAQHVISAGQFFGEMSLLSGRPRQGDAIAGEDCILIETPRRIMVKLMNSNDDVRQGIDSVFVMRALQSAFRNQQAMAELLPIAAATERCTFDAGETLYREAEPADCLHLIRNGTVTLSRGESAAVVAQAQSGEMVGQLAMLGGSLRQDSAKATVRTETIKLRKAEFEQLIDGSQDALDGFYAAVASGLKTRTAMEANPNGGRAIEFLMTQGLGEATNALVIDENLCVGCNNCETACAATHGGISRLDRSVGASHAGLHVPVACRHCENPHCMKDCPADAIHRSVTGEVFIDDSCIGCGNCETNCPYDVIQLAAEPAKEVGFWSGLLNKKANNVTTDSAPKALKCDACMDISSGPACVQSCPTGAAKRLSPAQFSAVVEGR